MHQRSIMMEAATVDLHQFAPAWGINPSPFCNKVETYFRLTGVPFRAVPSDPSTAPKGKLPYIVDQGRQIPDSGQIIAHLQAVRGDPLDGGLNAKQRALGHLLRRTCEESLYFALCYSRWIDEANWPIVRQAFFAGLPPAIEPHVATQTREGVARALQGQGYGRHSPDEIYALGVADIDALAAALGGQPFFVAHSPTSFDASIYAALVCLARAGVESPLKASVLSHANLQAYLERIDEALAAAGPRV